MAATWLAFPDRNAVTRAANEFDRQLRVNPLHFGESRQSSVRRIAIEPPLGIEFEVIEDDKKVRVLGVWLTGCKPSQIIGWQGGDNGSTLTPPKYQKLEGPWIDGKDSAGG